MLHVTHLPKRDSGRWVIFGYACRFVLLSILCAIFISGCARSGDGEFDELDETESGEVEPAAKKKRPEFAAIHGTVWYRERVALHPGSDLRVTLARNARFDDPFMVIADKSWDISGNIPLPFSLFYDPDLIQKDQHYSLRAQIVREGYVWFETPQPIPIIPGQVPPALNVLVVRTR